MSLQFERHRQCQGRTASLYEVALIFAGLAIVSGYLVFTLPAFDRPPARLLVVGVCLVALTSVHPRVFERLSAAFLTRLGRQALPAVLRGYHLLGLLLLYALMFLYGGFCLLVLAEALWEVPAADAAVIIAAFPLGTLASALGSALPGGLGARELGLVVAMSTVMPTSEALILAIAVRVVQIAVELMLTSVTQAVVMREASPERVRA